MFRNALGVLTDAAKSLFNPADHAEAQYAVRERAQVILNSIGDAVLSTDVNGIVTYLNPVAERMTGWPAMEATGRPLPEVLRILNGDTREPALNPLAMAIQYDKPVALSANSILVSRDGYEAAIEDTSAPIHDRRGSVIGAVIVFHDVSEARALTLRMSHLAQHDYLTDLPNRMLLHDRLVQAMMAAKRHRQSLAVLYIDVDDFKHINDSLGHAAGDQLLRSIAQRLLASVRGSDTVSRPGGDEFVVLLSEVACADDAIRSADKILAAVRAPHHVGNEELKVTVSIGIAVWPADGADADTLLGHADRAMLRAKACGGGFRQAFVHEQRPGQLQRVS
jgi:diguanylate cyclase (GGDEF)-like protein/PAS domain S-box-containing protein